MVRVRVRHLVGRVRGWVTCNANESPHKGSSTRICVSTSVCECVCVCPYVFAEEKTRHSFSSCPHLLPIHVKNQSRVKTCLNFPRLCDYGVREALTDLCATEASPRHLACHARLVHWRLPVKRL